jgi:hypothetical protein
VAAITAINPELNVNMDAAFEAVAYAIGDGLDSASDPAGPGTVTLPAASISICLGKLDETGGQAALTSGTIDVATITTACGEVTITADALRGGIVGDAVVAGTIAGGPVCDGPTLCVGDIVENGIIGIPDLQALVGLLGNSYDLINPALPFLGSEYAVKPADADYPANAAVYNYDMSADGIIGISDLQQMTIDLGNNYHLINPALPFLGSEYSFPCAQ